MRQNKKSQVALDFLMTYGWAILVVLVAIGALAYFGVLIPDKYLDKDKKVVKEVKYCLEWDGWIDRDRMVFNCYDFNEQKIKCGFDILDNENLIVHMLDNTTQEYNCSKYIMAIEVLQ